MRKENGDELWRRATEQSKRGPLENDASAGTVSLNIQRKRGVADVSTAGVEYGR